MSTAFLLLLLLGAPDLAELKKSYLQAVQDSDWKTVRRAADSIAATGSRPALSLLNEELRLAADEAHRRAIFHALSTMKQPELIGFFEDHAGDVDPYYRAFSVKGLALQGHKGATAMAANLYTNDEDARVRRVAVEVLAGYGNAAAASALLEGLVDHPHDEQMRVLATLKGFPATELYSAAAIQLRGSDPEARLAAVLALAVRNSPLFLAEFEQLASDPDRRVATVATAARDRIREKGSASLRSLLAKAKSFDQKYELYDLIARGRLKDPALVAELEKATRSGHKLLRPRAAETLGTVAGAQAVPALTKLIGMPKPWQLPIGAARGLGATRSAEAIPPLIEALHKAEGRLTEEIAMALESLTGQPFGTDAKLWARWWRERGAGFQVKPVATPLWEDETSNDGYAFYGIRIRSHAVAFVCDVSGSMKGGPLETLKAELKRFVKRFPQDGRFNFVFFNRDVHPWRKRLVRANKKTKRAALDVVENLAADGATNLWDALQFVMKDPTVDTMILLSDGSPTAGKIQRLAEIRDEFTRQNRARMILVHVVAIGHEPRALREMALGTGGSFVRK